MYHPALLICGQALIKCFKSLSPSSSFQINSYFDKILIISYFLAVPRDQAYLSPYCCHCGFIFHLRLCFSTRTSEFCILQKHVALSLPFQSQFILGLQHALSFVFITFYPPSHCSKMSLNKLLCFYQAYRVTTLLYIIRSRPPSQLHLISCLTLSLSPCCPLVYMYSPSLHFPSQHNHPPAALGKDPKHQKSHHQSHPA